MAERKPFWTSLPGVISGLAATITGLAVLIPLMLGVAGKHPKRDVSATQPSPGSPSASGPESPTPSTEAGVTDSTSPGETGGPSPTPSPTGPAMLAATPASVTFGSVAAGKSSQDVTLTINNTGGPSTIDSVDITGANQAAFAIAGTTCGKGSNVPAQGSCQITLRFGPPSVASDSASLEIHYHPPDSSFTTVSLSGTGTLL